MDAVSTRKIEKKFIMGRSNTKFKSGLQKLIEENR
jgi:hypothetical protein